MVDKELVISSDDLGMSWSVNRGIEHAYDLHALTSTNFMVPCPWFEHAAKRFGHLDLDLGVHLTLTCEWRSYTWRPLTSAASLLDLTGRMHPTIALLMEHARAEDIRAECRAQIQHALQRCPGICYVDVHMCIPSFKDGYEQKGRAANPAHERALMQIVQDVAEEFGLPYPYALVADQLVHFDSALSISGKSRAAVEAYIQSLRPGIHHLSCHCSVPSEEQANLTDPDDDAAPWALAFRVEDLATITSDWFSSLLSRNEVRLVSMPFSAPRARTSRRAD